ncbi:dihydrofolate reductase family protein [uncultured Chitinophaga sp.]|uniref:dihydrofolate reductase family protein n=1 Tax=uncultured Chitinophaga sp. TaxID=339340 RepID=UPI0025F866CC|nr:dihydrofolate reductase family protein [uncultured Chitinophaga sp.]
MRRIIFQTMISLDGFFEGPHHELNWHVVDDEMNEVAIDMLNRVDTIIFGRITYEMMAAFWPTYHSMDSNATVAHKMNNLNKIVFSRTLQSAEWKNAVLIQEDAAPVLERLKRLPGKDMVIMGSSQLAASLIPHDLIDEFRILVAPVVLGKGHTLFEGMHDTYKLKLTRARMLRSGNVVLYYQPEKRINRLTVTYSAKLG